MLIYPADPRDQTTEVVAPFYRVNLWDDPTRSMTYELNEADVFEVLNWLQTQKASQYSLWACYSVDDEVVAVRLAGCDPTADESTWPRWAKPSL